MSVNMSGPAPGQSSRNKEQMIRDQDVMPAGRTDTSPISPCEVAAAPGGENEKHEASTEGPDLSEVTQ